MMGDDVEVKAIPLPFTTTVQIEPTTNPTLGISRLFDCDFDQTDCGIIRTILNDATGILTVSQNIPGLGRVGDVSSISNTSIIFRSLFLFLYIYIFFEQKKIESKAKPTASGELCVIPYSYDNKQNYHCNLVGECLTQTNTFSKCFPGRFFIVKSPEEENFDFAYIVNVKLADRINLDVQSDYIVKFYAMFHLSGRDKECLTKGKDFFQVILNDGQNANLTTYYYGDKLERESIWTQYEIAFRSFTGKLKGIYY